MKIIPFIYDDYVELFANSFLIVDDEKTAVLVDPGKEDKTIVEYIENNHITLKAILLTHGHFDHIRGVDYFESHYSVPIYIHPRDKEYLTNPRVNCSDRFSLRNVVIQTNNLKEIVDRDKINILTNPIIVIETPFHTPGSVCFYLPGERALISGDTLFLESIGRTDFPGSDSSLIDDSLAKLMLLDDDTKVYPGHGPETTIGYEKKQNPFVKR